MNITVVGASGGTGREVVHWAAVQGHLVTAIARHPDRAAELAGERVTLVPGDVLADEPLPIPAETDAVISALGPDNGRKPTTIYSRGMTAILDRSRGLGIHRVVAISAVPVAAAAERTLLERVLVHPILWRVFGESYRDLRRMESLLAESGDIDWTVVRPPLLTDDAATGEYRIGAGHLRGARKISRADLGRALVEVAVSPQWNKTTVIVAA